MKKMETLAQAVARLDDTLDTMGDTATFVALIPRSSDFNFISETVNDIAEQHGKYVGELSWSALDDEVAKLKVGFAIDTDTYSKKFYGGNDDPSRFRWS